MNVHLQVTAKGLPELEKALGYKLQDDPEFEDFFTVRGSISSRLRRQGKGLGAQRNSIISEAQPMMLTATSTLNNPRQSGASWKRYMLPVLWQIVQRKLNKLVRGIEARFAS